MIFEFNPDSHFFRLALLNAVVVIRERLIRTYFEHHDDSGASALRAFCVLEVIALHRPVISVRSPVLKEILKGIRRLRLPQLIRPLHVPRDHRIEKMSHRRFLLVIPQHVPKPASNQQDENNCGDQIPPKPRMRMFFCRI